MLANEQNEIAEARQASIAAAGERQEEGCPEPDYASDGKWNHFFFQIM